MKTDVEGSQKNTAWKTMTAAEAAPPADMLLPWHCHMRALLKLRRCAMAGSSVVKYFANNHDKTENIYLDKKEKDRLKIKQTKRNKKTEKQIKN